MENTSNSLAHLKLRNVIGFRGEVPGGVIVSYDRQHIIYTLGCAVIVENLDTAKQEVLQGHTDNVVCIALSPCGNYLASGQATYMGFKADIILWDFNKLTQLATFNLHKVRIMSLSFSVNSKYLVSLGGQDDGCVVVWSIEKKIAICGSPAQPKSAGITRIVLCSNTNDDIFITAGDNSLRIWNLDIENRKIRPTECQLGQTKRSINCAVFSKEDEYFYCGTSSGDILSIKLPMGYLTNLVPEKNKFSLGVTALALIKDKALIVGTGDGLVQELALKWDCDDRTCKLVVDVTKHRKILGGVMSISPRGLGHQFFVTTNKCHLYRFNYCDYAIDLLSTCHYSAINDVKFPRNCSDLIVSCGYQDVRIFHIPTNKELLRINIPNMTCFCIDVLRNGKAIISGWNDSKIRVFYPETGRLMYTINDAHKKGVTAIACTNTGRRIISGGGEGQLRVWEITEVCNDKNKTIPYSKKSQKGIEGTYVTRLIATMKEHANAISSIMINKDDSSCVSSSADGTCIVWCLEKFRRKQVIFANTLFRVVCYHPEECQIVTSGTDRNIGFWELYDGSLIRELTGSKSGSVNGLDMSSNGEFFVTGGDDKMIKVWKYQEGDVIAVGDGHSSAITRVKISPNQKFVVSVCEDGGIFIWELPEQEPEAITTSVGN